MLREVSLFICYLLMVLNVEAQVDSVFLYPDGVPGLKDTTNREFKTQNNDGLLRVAKVIQPCIYPFIPANSTDKTPAVVICPGGGYWIVSMESEGFNVARWLQAHGVAAFVLKYRLPDASVFDDKSIVPLQDVQQTYKYLHENAKKYNIDKNNIGIMGFSAGGHLAASASVLYKESLVAVKPRVLRPAFSILIYPVITFGDKYTHKGTRKNLIGPEWSSAVQDHYSCEKQVDGDTPPAFLLCAKDDGAEPYQNSELYKAALDVHQVENHIVFFDAGGHGFGLQPGRKTNVWIDEAWKWMQEMNIIN